MKPVLCIPSYSRPDGTAIERCKDLPMRKFLFIRKGQLELYRHWSKWYTLVLQTGGSDIGIVRNNMVRYLHGKGYDWAFILDDDISKVECLGYREDGVITSKRIIAGVPGPRMETEAFKVWYKTAKDNGISLSSPNHRAYDRFHHGELRVNKSACIQCVLIKVQDVISVGGYKSIQDTGNEDYYLQYKLMKAGFFCGKIGSIEYDCPAVGSGKGGNNAEEYTDINSKYNSYVDTFLRKVCNDPKYVTTKVTSRGQKSIQFNWVNWNGFSKPLELKEDDNETY